MLRVAKEQQEEIDAEDRSRRGPSSGQVNTAPSRLHCPSVAIRVKVLGVILRKAEKGLQECACIMQKLRAAGLRLCSAHACPSTSHILQAAGLQYATQPAHDSDSEGSEIEEGYSDEDWLEDEVRDTPVCAKAG